MKRCRISALLALLLVLILGACDAGSNEGPPSGDATGATGADTEALANVAIVSSLEGMDVLPRHVRWTVTTSVPPERIEDVQFKVDRQTLWTDPEPPFSYGVEGAYLATSRFWDRRSDKPGGRGHLFTVRLRATDGSKWNEEVSARVPRLASSPRAPTYGIWARLSPNAPKNPTEFSQRRYNAHLWMSGFGLWVGRSPKRAFLYELSADAKHFHLGVPIFLGSEDEPAIVSGYHANGYQCTPEGPPASYAWSWTKDRFGPFNERHLVLRAKRDPCSERRRILEGVWELLD